MLSKNKNVSLWEKKAPAGALSPSTVLLRAILSVSKTKTAILSSQKIRMSLLGREEAPAGALTPSTVLLRVFYVLTTQNSPICVCLQQKTAGMYFQTIRMSLFGRENAPVGALSPSTVLLCLYNI